MAPQHWKQVRCKKRLSNQQAQLQAGPGRDPQREPLRKAHKDAHDGDTESGAAAQSMAEKTLSQILREQVE